MTLGVTDGDGEKDGELSPLALTLALTLGEPSGETIDSDGIDVADEVCVSVADHEEEEDGEGIGCRVRGGSGRGSRKSSSVVIARAKRRRGLSAAPLTCAQAKGGAPARGAAQKRTARTEHPTPGISETPSQIKPGSQKEAP